MTIGTYHQRAVPHRRKLLKRRMVHQVAAKPTVSIMEKVKSGNDAIAAELEDFRSTHMKVVVNQISSAYAAGCVQTTMNRYEEIITAMMIRIGV